MSIVGLLVLSRHCKAHDIVPLAEDLVAVEVDGAAAPDGGVRDGSGVVLSFLIFL